MICATTSTLSPDVTTSTCFIQVLDDMGELAYTVTWTDNTLPRDRRCPFNDDVEEFSKWVLSARRYVDMIHEISRKALHDEGLAHARRHRVLWASEAACRVRQHPSQRRRRRMQRGPRR